jgi:transcriptional regulator with XRE-family HTH domain
MRPGIMVREARRRVGLTQRALAEMAGVPQPTVARIESGSVSPRADTFERLLRAARSELVVEPRLGIGVDRTQIRDRFAKTPAQRIRLAVDEAHALGAIGRDR